MNNFLSTFVIAMVVMIGGCKKDDFAEIIGKCPKVISTSPVNAAVAVPLNTIITITFNEKMNASTLNDQSIIISGANAITGIITYTDSTASFKPTVPLLPNTSYTGRVTTSVKDVTGNALQTDYIWTFSTGIILTPNVIITDPANLATGVVLNKTIGATFSMNMDPQSINSSTFLVSQGNANIAGVLVVKDKFVTFKPDVALLPNTKYTGTITTGAKNTLGTGIQNNYTWTFTTGTLKAPSIISTDPSDNAIGVAQNKVITAKFDDQMNGSTINSASFKVYDGLNVVNGKVSFSGNTAAFTPSGLLLPNTLYTAVITSAVKNKNGVPISGNNVWTFTTNSVTPPVVVSSIPVNGATGVSLNTKITASFSLPMDPVSLNQLSFIVSKGGIPIPGDITYSSKTVYFTPTGNLLPGIAYTATITSAAKSISGINLVTDYVWTFTTGLTNAPYIIQTSPQNNEKGVAINKVITATFNEAMLASSLNSSSFIVKSGSATINGNISINGNTVSFNPAASLEKGTLYTATFTTEAKNLAGTSIKEDYVWEFTTTLPSSPPGVDLKSVARFGIIAGVGVSNNAGFSEIHNMDVGISPGVRSSITGFPPAIIINGAIYASDDIAPPGTPAMLVQAKQDLTDAFLFTEGAITPAPATVSGDQGGKTLAPGIYKSTSTLLIQSGDLTLDAQGDPNAVWIFQIAAGFTTVGGAGGSIIMSGGAQAKNIFWQVGSSATIGDYTSFKGNVLALTSITMNSGAIAEGRMLAINGAVVMTNSNIIKKP